MNHEHSITFQCPSGGNPLPSPSNTWCSSKLKDKALQILQHSHNMSASRCVSVPRPAIRATHLAPALQIPRRRRSMTICGSQRLPAWCLNCMKFPAPGRVWALHRCTHLTSSRLESMPLTPVKAFIWNKPISANPNLQQGRSEKSTRRIVAKNKKITWPNMIPWLKLLRPSLPQHAATLLYKGREAERQRENAKIVAYTSYVEEKDKTISSVAGFSGSAL